MAGDSLERGTEEKDNEVVGETHQPAADEVVSSTAQAGASPGQVPDLQDQGPHQAQEGAAQVRHRQAEDQAGELTVPEPDSEYPGDRQEELGLTWCV